MKDGQVKPHIASIAVAVPPYRASQKEAEAFFTRHYAGRLSSRSLSLIHKVFSHPSIGQRFFAFEDPDCLVDEDPDERIARFSHWAVELSSRAVLEALEKVSLGIEEVSALVVNTCTGYICPGISTYLIESLGLSRRTRVYDLVGSGCGGAIPNLEVASSQIPADGKGVVLSVSVEICSATFQMGDDLSLIISNALFGDGASAAVLWNRPQGLELVATSSRYAPEHRDNIRYVHKNGQLYNRLSTVLPRLVKRTAADAVGDVLSPQGLSVADIRNWALHTGGDKVINEMQKELGLSHAQLEATRRVLTDYGNMSSPTVWFVLDSLLDAGIGEGEWCVMAAFGAGLSAHACLLKKS